MLFSVSCYSSREFCLTFIGISLNSVQEVGTFMGLGRPMDSCTR
jgi:hypothetical protein